MHPNNQFKTRGNKSNREDPRANHKKNRRRRLFIKTFIVSFVLLGLLVLAGWLTLRMAVRTPPVIAQSDAPEKTGNENHSPDSAYLVITEDEPEDLSVWDGSPAPEGFTPEDRKPLFYTFLIFGLDNGINTDTIMAAAYDGVAHKAYLIGLPRDGKVNVERSVKKINAAYPVGTLRGGGREGGVARLKRELKTIIGFVPDYYVCVDFKAFKRLVDAIGGVEVYVPIDMLYDDKYQNLHINIPKGNRVLDGEDALKFARYRTGNDRKNSITDYQRIENQQAVIKSAASKLLNPASLLKIPEFIDIFQENVFTDIKLTEMLWFADQLKDIPGRDALETYTMPTTGTTGPPSYYELFDEAAVVELINRTINPYTINIEAQDLDIAK